MRHNYESRYPQRGSLKEGTLYTFLQKNPLAISDITGDEESTWYNWHQGLNPAAKKELLTIEGNAVDDFLAAVHKGVVIETLTPGVLSTVYGIAKQFVYFIQPASKEPMIAFIVDRKLLPFLALK